MIAAFTIWNGRIAPVFDVAGHVLLVDSSTSGTTREYIPLPQGDAEEKLRFLLQHQVQVVVCGAMTRYTNRFAQGLGIEVLPFIAGDQQEVIDSWRSGNLIDNRFSMPGCGRNNCLCKQQGRQRRQGGRSCSGQQRPPDK